MVLLRLLAAMTLIGCAHAPVVHAQLDQPVEHHPAPEPIRVATIDGMPAGASRLAMLAMSIAGIEGHSVLIADDGCSGASTDGLRVSWSDSQLRLEGPASLTALVADELNRWAPRYGIAFRWTSASHVVLGRCPTPLAPTPRPNWTWQPYGDVWPSGEVLPPTEDVRLRTQPDAFAGPRHSDPHP